MKADLCRGKAIEGGSRAFRLIYHPPSTIRLAASGASGDFGAAIHFDLMFIVPAVFAAGCLNGRVRNDCAGMTGVGIAP